LVVFVVLVVLVVFVVLEFTRNGGDLRLENKEIKLSTNGWVDLVDITPQVSQVVHDSGVEKGVVLVYVRDKEAAVITMEAEMALMLDTADFVTRLVDRCRKETKGHIAVAVLGSSMSVPVAQGYLGLGSWQQIVVVDLGEPGEKSVGIQVVGN
jgi:secondary thiamine-phosphate synthase enzyme